MHATHLFVLRSHAGVAPPHCASEVQSTQWFETRLQACPLLQSFEVAQSPLQSAAISSPASASAQSVALPVPTIALQPAFELLGKDSQQSARIWHVVFCVEAASPAIPQSPAPVLDVRRPEHSASVPLDATDRQLDCSDAGKVAALQQVSRLAQDPLPWGALSGVLLQAMLHKRLGATRTTA